MVLCKKKMPPEGDLMKDTRISEYFDTKYMTLLWMEQILHIFEDKKFAYFFNFEQVNFRMTLVICLLTGLTANLLFFLSPWKSSWRQSSPG